MKAITPMTLRTKVLLAVLAVLLALWAFSSVRVNALESDLAAVVQRNVDDYVKDGCEVVTKIAVYKDYVLFGPATGEVKLFARPREGGDAARVQCVNHRYRLAGGTWQLIESAASDDEESQALGRQAFTGYGTP